LDAAGDRQGQKERKVPLPIDVVGELAKYMVSPGLNADPEDFSNQGAFLLGRASDTAERAPSLSKGQRIDPRQGIAATTFYDQIKAFFADCAGVLRQQGGQGDAKGAERFESRAGGVRTEPSSHGTDLPSSARIVALRSRVERIPFLGPIDLRFRSRVRVPVPTSKAVMFCLMDVSGSMDEGRKDLSKRLFILLYLFLTRHYEKIDLVFIRHYTQAQEVDEQNFFHARENGGTVVSSALVLMEEIIKARYSPAEWNIYGAQASDGDNWHHDSGRCRELLNDKLLPLVRYFAYVQVAEEEQNLWTEYSQVLELHKHFAMRKATTAAEIYPVFRDLFKKAGAKAA